ncbi:MAG: hypothetical protein U0599_09225 [Vicinamibacteria bacterium]
MPVDWELRGFVLRLIFTGLVERHEIEGLEAALADPRSARGLGGLCGTRDSQTALHRGPPLEDGPRGRPRRPRRRPAAEACSSTSWRATLSTSAEAARLRPGFRLEMFTDESEAVAWLSAGESETE